MTVLMFELQIGDNWYWGKGGLLVPKTSYRGITNEELSSPEYVIGFHITRLPHTHKIKLTFLPEMDCWSNTLSCSTLFPLGLASLISAVAFFRPCQSHDWKIGAINGHGFIVMVCI